MIEKNKVTENSQTDSSPKSDLGTKHTSASSKKESWNLLHDDLKSALNQWEDLTTKLADRKSPDEVQLSEVRNILKNLKNQLSEFED